MRARARRVLVAAALVAAPGCDGSGGSGSAAPPPTPHERLAELVERGERFSGSAELAAAADWARDALAAAGLDARLQRYRFPRHEVLETRAEAVAPDGARRALESFPVFYAAPTGGELLAPVRRRGDADLDGAFLLSDHSSYRDDLDAARALGALGVVIGTDRRPLYSGDGVFAASVAARWDAHPTPGAVVDGVAALAGGDTWLALTTRSRIAPGEGRNVVALWPGREDRWVVLTAHLDSWFTGAVDDGSGVAVALAAAERLAATRHRRGLVVLLADGEELGLLGSSVFLRRLEEIGLAWEKLDAVVELDMVSSLGAYGGGAPEAARPFPRFLVTTPGLEPEARAIDAALSTNDPILPVSLAELTVGIRTDARWLFHRGVPGLFVNVLTAHYHSPRDTLEWVDADDLADAADGATEALAMLLERDPPLPVTPHLPLDLELAREGGEIAMELRVGDALPSGRRGGGLVPWLRVHTDLGRVASVEGARVPGSVPPRYRARVPVAPELPVEVLATVTDGLLAGDTWAALPAR